MRLLKIGSRRELSLTKDIVDNIPLYAILSHTWGADHDEVTFDDLEKDSARARLAMQNFSSVGNKLGRTGRLW